ncbi:MAG TPA: hypothetical protein ENH87_11240 [Pricia antarctica]|uniref:Uncharacterized protein n=1 Tax=Pricia antarctica TaxID=641691 RepID=A0A831VS01_9FLAO|nr:hypothetical protein [Pricia antarctica]
MVIGSGSEMGVKSYFAFWKEDAFGTVTGLTAGTGASTLEPLNFSVKTEIVSQKLEQIGINRGFTKRVQLDKNVAGTMEQNYHPQESVLLTAVALGGGITTASLSGGFTHQLDAGDFDTSPSSLMFKVRKGQNHFWEYKGVRINQMTISGNVGEMIKASYEIIAQDSSLTGADISGDLSISAILPYTYVQGVYRYHSNIASMTATVEEFIQGFELVINNNMITDANARALGSNTPQIFPPTRRSIEFKVQQRFDTNTIWNRFVQATQGSVQLRFVGQSASAKQNYTCVIDMPKVFVNSPEPEVAGPNEILSSEITYDVLVDNPDTSTGYDIRFTFINSTTSY